MKLLRAIAIISICFFQISNSHAEEAEPHQLLELAKVTGVYEQFEQDQKTMAERTRQMGIQYKQQVLAINHDLPPEFQKIYQKELEAYTKKFSKLIDSEAAVQSYIQLIGKKLDKTDVDTIINFYKSDVGKKYVQTNSAVLAELSKLRAPVFYENLIRDVQEFKDNVDNAILSFKK